MPSLMEEKTKSWISMVAAVVAAVCALLTVTQEKMGAYSIILLCLGGLVLYVILLLIRIIVKGRTKGYPGKIAVLAEIVQLTGKLLRTVAISGMAVGIISLCTISLTNFLLRKVIVEECNAIAQETKKDILKKSREDHEVVIASLVDSVTARKVVYSNALDQASDNGYVFPVAKWYIPSEGWRDKDKGTTLLTDEEKRIIARCFGEQKSIDLKENDLKNEFYSLMYSILSDDEMIAALQRDEAYNVPSESEGQARQLSAYDKIGVIGAYIGE